MLTAEIRYSASWNVLGDVAEATQEETSLAADKDNSYMGTHKTEVSSPPSNLTLS